MKDCEKCKEKNKPGESCEICAVFNKTLDRYSQANIPFKYWKIKMNKDSFRGPESLFEEYEKVIQDIDKTYDDGTCLMFCGVNGCGKTTVCTGIAKRAVEKGYSAQYVTLNDIILNLVQGKESLDVRNSLVMVDFLVIDEFDERYIATNSQASADLFGRILEDIVRTRVQNSLPTFFCSNSTDPENAFSPALQKSIKSLMNYVKKIPVFGKDLRKEKL